MKKRVSAPHGQAHRRTALGILSLALCILFCVVLLAPATVAEGVGADADAMPLGTGELGSVAEGPKPEDAQNPSETDGGPELPQPEEPGAPGPENPGGPAGETPQQEPETPGDEGDKPGDEEEKEAPERFTVRFLIEQETDALFADNTTEWQLEVEAGEQLTAAQLPVVVAAQPGYALQGWQNGEQLYTPEELEGFAVEEDIAFTAVLRPPLMRTNMLTAAASIAGIIQDADASRVAIVPHPTDAGQAYQSFTGNEAGLKQALFALYQYGQDEEGHARDYVLYIGTNITSNANAGHIGRKAVPASPSATNITLTALEGRVGTLTIVGRRDDPITTNTTDPGTANARTLTLNAEFYTGCNLVLRNVRYAASNVYMMGHDLTMEYGSWCTGGLTVYGGGSAADDTIAGSPQITVNATGYLGVYSFYGGGRAGSLTGNPVIVINNTSAGMQDVYGGPYNGTVDGSTSVTINSTKGALRQVSGGAYSGTVTGNTSLLIENTGGNITALYGGARVGTVGGNVTTLVKNTGGNIGAAGTGNNLYGAGYGTNAANSVEVGGNVSTTILNMRGLLYDFYGGANYGNVAGTVTNVVQGDGGNAASISLYFGGSYNGNIGTAATRGTTVIQNTVDTSGYTRGGSHSRRFVGANQYAGIIQGNIHNTVTAGLYNQAPFNGTFGGGGIDTTNAESSNNALDSFGTGTTQAERDARAAYAKSQSRFQVYGDIYTEMTQGCFSTNSADASYARGAGYGGYIEGNTTLEVGTEGLAYAAPSAAVHNRAMAAYNNGNWVYSSTNSLGYSAAWDIVGGGGSTGYFGPCYIKGNTTLIHRNTIARWTYGGGFGGVIDGDTQIQLYNGNIDTCEGGGYRDYRIYGNTAAYVYNGQVNWFLSGGGWNDQIVYGNAYVEVWNGKINASIAGTFGVGDHLVQGNAEIMVYGGDFDGLPRDTPSEKGFSGGANRNGTIAGNSKVTLDLRKQANPPLKKDGTPVEQGGFVLPRATNITGGRRHGASNLSILGTDATNTMELNIFTDPGSDVLAGANLYGDGGSNNAYSRGGSITINVDAPGSSIGTLYASNDTNINGNKLLRDVSINLNEAVSIGGINGGASGDDYNNNIIARTNTKPSGAPDDWEPNRAVINVGYGNDDTDTIEIKTNGIQNFTHLNVDSKLLMVTGTTVNGSIRNGTKATATTHRNTGNAGHNTFGDIRLQNGGGIGIAGSTTAPIISGGALTIEGPARLVSPSGDGRVLVTDFIPEDDLALLEWTRNGGTNLVNSSGNWFGPQSAYRVLTFSPTGENARHLTPLNFKGKDETTLKTYIGDNDTSTNPDKYGIAIPGSYVDARVLAGEGDVRHDVTDARDGTDGQGGEQLPIVAYGNVPANTPVQRLVLAIPNSTGILPGITYTPETENTGSWLKHLTVQSSSTGYDTAIGERPDSLPVTWRSTQGEYSYDLSGIFTNQAELSARSIILTETQAAGISTANHIISLNEADGRPFFGNNINQTLINAVSAPLGVDVLYRTHTVRYRSGLYDVSGLPTGNAEQVAVNIVVVKDGTLISEDRHAALYARGAAFTTSVAQQLTGEAELTANFTKAFVILSDGTLPGAVIDDTAMDRIKAVTATETVPVTYSYTPPGESAPLLSKTVDIVVADEYVCKIGTTGYDTLEDAMVVANAGPGTVVIEMLVDEYKDATAMDVTGDVVITTAAKDDAILPYKGEGERATIFMGAAAANSSLLAIPAGGTLTLQNIGVDGNRVVNTNATEPMFLLSGGTFALGEGAAVSGYAGIAPVVSVQSGTFNITGEAGGTGGVLQNNTTASAQGTVYIGAGAAMNMDAGQISGNTAANGGGVYIDDGGTFALSGGTLTGNLALGDGAATGFGGGIYQNGTLNLSGNVRAIGNRQQAESEGAIHSNIYLPVTSTAESATARVITVTGPLSDESEVGVLTETSPQATDPGTQATIIAVPANGTDLEPLADLFAHDQLARNENAFHVVHDRVGAQNLVLDYGSGVVFRFAKVDAKDTSLPLENAEFVLYHCTNPDPNHLHTDIVTPEVLESGACWQPYMAGGTQQPVYVSGAGGLVDFGTLPNGDYMLVESKAPAGYETPTGQWLLQIDDTAAGRQRIVLTAKGPKLPPAFLRTGENDFQLPNMEPLAIPMAGSTGIYPFVTLGAMLLASATALLVLLLRRRKKRSVRKLRMGVRGS